ncbi:hypothetical protein [Natribacillus halophilus]|uniref:Uncharacterized protein n=1 Tax=Natribacillus halophilus TaxID=549003 RepID=A0A1G8PBK1_9BACI|nr:hypothetical protein [Natribacillus halophilus]SDI89941.1 hypothetical protein SAMN04488123_10853 [Natribacillus halophilus]
MSDDVFKQILGELKELKDQQSNTDRSVSVMSSELKELKDQQSNTDRSVSVMSGELKELKDQQSNTDRSVSVMSSELKGLQDQQSNTDRSVNAMWEEIKEIKDEQGKMGKKFDKIDKNLDYNTQMTENTLEYAGNIDKNQQKHERYLTKKVVEHDKDIFHIKDKMNI